jgi:putative membrane-bound dehydrogenase-like protein
MGNRWSLRWTCRLSLSAIGVLQSVNLTQNVLAQDKANSTATSEAGDFNPITIQSIALEISDAEFTAMQPPPPAFPGQAGPPQPPAANDGRQAEFNLFGVRFPWAEGSATINGRTFSKVGIRYAGDITYFVSAGRLKRPLAIQLDRFESQQLDGMTSIQLHAMPLDPSKAREVLALSVFREAGVPVPRAAFAEVTLKVPGKHESELLGLFTIVEGINPKFVSRRLGTDEGLLMKPFGFGLRGIDDLGEDWGRYVGTYRPHRDATKDEAARVVAFAKLVNQAGDEEFGKQIGSFLDVDAFLRFMAANALTSNLESFFALGHNYWLHLDPKSGVFTFVPGDLEFSLANFLLLGTPEQLMDLSLMKPYPGENKLPDRLLTIPDVKARYQKILAELTGRVFSKERLLKSHEALQQATRQVRDKEAEAANRRTEAPAGFGGGPIGPQPPDIRTFIEKRTASIASQLAGTSQGFVPQPFGPPAGGGPGGPRSGNSGPISEEAFRESVQVPPEFAATLFAVSPEVNYPVAIAAAPNGDVYVAIDEQGSLGRTPDGGRIVRCVDRDDDGKVDEVTEFARVEHPRGLCIRDGSVWVMHPPTLSVFRDTNGDGVADQHEELVTGLTTDQVTERGGDHTTNCVRMGIDGWLYIGVGDYGIKRAEGKDGTVISQRGGGIVRVRPDGTELEVFCTGLRNPFDVAIDPFLNLFTRDNTNDGAGWDVRVSHLIQTAEYGYTRLFANFTEETMPTMGTFGGGGGTGGLFVQDPAWPEAYRNALLTGDWGRSEVYLHELKPHGSTFDAQQEVFLKVPRATGMDIDGSGRLYVASWWGGEASVHVGPHVGFVTRVTPKEIHSEAMPDLRKARIDELVQLLAAPQSVRRLHAQGEILRRGEGAEITQKLVALASKAEAPLEGRVAAIFTLKQVGGAASHPSLLKLAADPAVREFALKALTDRKSQLEGLGKQPFVDALGDASPRVRAQALISLGRLNDVSAATDIIPLTSRPAGSTIPTQRPVQNQPDADRAIPHLAVRALASLRAVDACLAALDGPHAQGALQTLRLMHDDAVVEGLVKKLATTGPGDLQRGILVALIRLYHREADYDGSWWGIRPDSTGPYYDRVKWEKTPRIEAVLKAAILDSQGATRSFLESELARHKVSIDGIPTATVAATAEPQRAIVVPAADPADPNQIGNLAYEAVLKRVMESNGDVSRGTELFKTQSCVACHTTADGQTPKGPHLVDIGKRYRAAELVESIVKPSEKLAQGFESYSFGLEDGRVFTGFIVSQSADAILIREANGLQHELKRAAIEARAQQKPSAMPNGLVNNLTPQQLADLLVYLQSLK